MGKPPELTVVTVMTEMTEMTEVKDLSRIQLFQIQLSLFQIHSQLYNQLMKTQMTQMVTVTPKKNAVRIMTVGSLQKHFYSAVLRVFSLMPTMKPLACLNKKGARCFTSIRLKQVN